jgi:protocatechuate 3,4-dioxygenase beta subunit
MKKIKFTNHPFIKDFLILFWVFFGSVLSIHGQLTTIGILPFSNESGVDLPSELGPKISMDLQQKLLTYTDLLPRVMGSEMDLESYKSMNIEQVVQYGREKGVMFLVRGGILSLSAEQTGKKEINITIELYAEIISVKSSDSSSVRAQGNGTEKGRLSDSGMPGASIQFPGKEFQDSALAKALTSGITQLASRLHEAVKSLSISDETAESLTPEPEVPGEEEEYIEEESPQSEEEQYTDEETDQSEEMSAAETDEELQQLITQAEELISDSSTDSESIDLLSQIVEQLKEALNSKLTLMEQGEDTSQIDQKIVDLKQNLESTISTIMQKAEVSYGEEDTSEYQTPDEEKRSLLAKMGEILEESLNVIQKIKEIRSAIKGSDQDSVYEETMEEEAAEEDQYTEESADEGEPTEESTEEISGVVTEEGEPVEGATVTDPESGVSTTTDSSGAYVLEKIPAGRFSNLLVIKDRKQVAMGKVDLIPGRAAIADFELKSRLSKKGLSSLRIIPASVIIAPQEKYKGKKGTLKGVIQDNKGKPIARALVKIKGLGMARTDSRGQYVFMNVPVGTHQLSINKRDMNVKSQQVNVTPGKINFNKIQFTSQDKILKKSEKTKIIIPQSAALINGVITDENNRPVVGAKVTVIHSSGAVSVMTGRNGVYKLKGLKPGNYRILVAKTGLANSSLSIDVISSKTKTYNFKLKKSSEYIQKVLARKKSALSALTSDHKSKLIGRVTDARTRKPLASAAVYIKGYNRIKTDRHGNYSVKNLSPGTYSATISKKGYVSQSIKITIGKAESKLINFVLKSTTRIKTSKVLTSKEKPSISVMKVQPGQIQGYVKDAKTGKPIVGAAISISGRSYTTNSRGMYTSSKLTPGTYTINVSKTGYSSSSRNIKVQPGKTSTANFSLNSLLLRLYKKK